MVRISFVINSLSAGGAERILVSLANHLATQNFDVHILTLSKATQGSFYPLEQKVTVHYLDYEGEKPRNPFAYAHRILKRMIRLRKTLKVLQPQTIISFMDLMNIATLLLTLGLKIPVIACERSNPTHHKIHWSLKLLRLITYRWAHFIAVQTPSAAAYFSTSLQPKIKVIPNFVKQPPILTSLKKDHHTIITVGRLDQHKDHATLIKAFAKIHTEFPTWKVLIYGQGPEQQNLEQLIQHLNLQQAVTLADNTKDIWTALAKADLFVFPTRYEGFPNALCEAMSIGLPVIASNVSGNQDIIQDGRNGLLFEAGDLEALANLMRDLIQHPDKQKQLGAEAQKLPQQYPAEKIFKQWEEMIRETIR